MSPTDALTGAASSSSWMTWLGTWLSRGTSLTVAAVAVGLGLLYRHQDRLLYFPTVGDLPRHNADNPWGYRHPGNFSPDYSSHRMPSADDGVAVHAWFMPATRAAGSDNTASAKLPVLLFFHGNAGNIGLRLPNAKAFMKHVHGVHLLLVDYRGYGDSDDAVPTEEGLQRDAVAAWDYVRKELATTRNDVDATQIYVFGRSLGGAVAVSLAAHAEAAGAPLAACLLENTFTSISAMVDSVLPFLTPIKHWVLTIGWDSLTLLRQGRLRRTPVLLLAGDADTLVPHAHMRALRAAAMEHVPLMQWHVIAGGTHNESWLQGGRPYWQAVADFVRDVRLQRLPAPQVPSTAADSTATSPTAIPAMGTNLLDMARDAWGNARGGKDKTT
jgi:pimeloyl-ACP methyl ester carboxylesterase